MAVLTNASLSRLSHLAKRLEARSLVRREPDPLDGGLTNAVLTPKGLRKLLVSAPGHGETVRALVIDVLSPAELQQLREASERMVAWMEPVERRLRHRPERTRIPA